MNAAGPVRRALATRFVEMHPAEAAGIAESWDADSFLQLVSDLDPKSGATVLEHSLPSAGAGVLAALDRDIAADRLTRMDPSSAVVLLGRIADEQRQDLLAAMPPRFAKEARELLAYPPDTAGSLMDRDVLTFRADTPAGHVLERHRTAKLRREANVVIVDASGRLSGVAHIGDIALAEPDAPVSSGMRRGPSGFARDLQTREDIVEELARLSVTSLPVVDAGDRVVGIIRQEALVRAVSEETSADLQTMVGASAEEHALSPVGFAVRKRLPWLLVNLLTAFLAASVVGLFESTIARFTALAVLLPVVAGQSGNTGAQALAVTMRGLSLREIRIRHWRSMSTKETLVGLVNGVGVALATSAAVFLWSRSAGLAGVIGLSMILSMSIAGLAGAAVPLLLTALGQDPAQSSSILLTTVTDVVGFFSFLGIAALMSGLL